MTERRRPLTARVRRGLRAALSLAEAGGEDNLIGYTPQTEEEKNLMGDVYAAIAWLDSVERSKPKR